MSRKKTKEDIINHKKSAIRKINNLFESYISTEDPTLLKKTDLMCYWLEEFAKYIYQEETFKPEKLLSYKRGDVIRVNLGFRIGNELGGLHYAVVIDNRNAHSAGVITIIPLSSTDGKHVHNDNVDLGTELYSKAEAQRRRLKEDAKKQLDETTDLIKMIAGEKLGTEKSESVLSVLEEKRDSIKKTMSIIERYDNELSKMKSGSMAVMNQVTTISKQRIYTPKRSTDFLYNVSLSESAMDKITKKLAEKLLFKRVDL